MNLDPRGREYVTWDQLAGPGDLDLEVSLDCGVTYSPTERVAGGVRALVAGPDVDQLPHPPGTIVAAFGRNVCQFRAVDNPEVLIRTAGSIDVY